MAGSSIAGRDAAAWVTDFLNAAYYRRPVDERDVDDLRFAFGVLTTYWYRDDPTRQLRVTDLPAFHRAFGAERFGTESRRGTLDREALERGAAKLIGDWFPEAYADDARRAWGIAFPTVAERDAYDPSHRLALAKLGELTAESAPLEEQVWHTYDAGRDAVRRGRHRRADAARDVAGLRERDRALHAAAARRAAGQTFEIEVAAEHAHGRCRSSPAATSRSRRWSRRTTRRRCATGSRRSRTAWRATARASRVAARGRRAARRLRPDHPPRALHGLRPQPAGALHARGPGVGAGRGHVGPDAVAPRQGLQGGRAARPSTRSGAPATTGR